MRDLKQARHTGDVLHRTGQAAQARKAVRAIILLHALIIIVGTIRSGSLAAVVVPRKNAALGTKSHSYELGACMCPVYLARQIHEAFVSPLRGRKNIRNKRGDLAEELLGCWILGRNVP
jgi:hypothetical protein